MQGRAAILIVPRSLYHYHLYISAPCAFLNREVERGHNLLAFDEQDHVREAYAVGKGVNLLSHGRTPG
jgi:hypothetical protein